MSDTFRDKVWQIPVYINSTLIRVTLGQNMYASEKDFYFLPHNHSGYELQLFSEGSCWIYTHRESYLAQAGDICIAHPNEYHSFLRVQGENVHMKVYSINLIIENAEIQADSQDINIQQALERLEYCNKIHDSTGSMVMMFALIQIELDEQKPGYLTAVKGLVSALLIKLFQFLLPDENVKHSEKVENYNAKREIMLERFFLFNYLKNPSINTLAEQLNICPRRVNQIINQMYGCSFSKKLVRTRLEVAKLMLYYTEHTITEIIALCGFHSQNYFYTTFHKSTGLSPSQFRKEVKRIDSII